MYVTHQPLAVIQINRVLVNAECFRRNSRRRQPFKILDSAGFPLVKFVRVAKKTRQGVSEFAGLAGREQNSGSAVI
jgi:hypothetical protein